MINWMIAVQTAPLIGLALVAAACDSGNRPDAGATADTAWTWLFDGQSTDAWRGFKRDTMPGGWQIVDGALTRVAGGGDIITREKFTDFELEFEWQVPAGGNSGVMYRVVENDDVRYTYESGPEYQILDNAGHRDGLTAETSAGSAYALYAPVRDVTNPPGEWNTSRIISHGDHVEHWLNGVKLLEFTIGSADWNERVENSKFRTWQHFGRWPEGHIAIQDHGDRVAFRNIRIRRP